MKITDVKMEKFSIELTEPFKVAFAEVVSTKLSSFMVSVFISASAAASFSSAESSSLSPMSTMIFPAGSFVGVGFAYGASKTLDILRFLF